MSEACFYCRTPVDDGAAVVGGLPVCSETCAASFEPCEEQRVRSDNLRRRVRALADQWNETPDYTPSDYDRGRVDQRHDMTGQLLEALGRPGRRRPGRRRREKPEAPELAAAVRRFVAALARRCAEGDDIAFEQLVEVRAAVDEAIGTGARAMHGYGYSWTEIGDRLGTSRQNARQRFGRRLGEEVSK